MMKSILLLVAVISAGQTLRPLIGSGSRGDGGPANEAVLDGPQGLAEDALGNVYISDSNAGVIRRVNPDGVIERFAGTNEIADGAEGWLAIETSLMFPAALAIDTDGGLFFADNKACRIRKVLTDGTIRDVVGTGRCGANAAGGPFGGGGGNPTRERSASEMDLQVVAGMTVDPSGLLVFSDETNHVIRRLDADGVVRVIAGSGVAAFAGDGQAATSAYLSSPHGVANDLFGNLYIADGTNCRIRRINPEGVIETVAGNGTCATATTNFSGGDPLLIAIGRISGLAYEPQTHSIIASVPGSARVLRLNLTASWLTSILGNGRRVASDATQANQYSIDEPGPVLASSKGILVAETTAFTVVQIETGTVNAFAGKWPQHDQYPEAIAASLLRPRGLCMDREGTLFVVDAGAERVLSFRDPDQLAAVAGARYPTGYSGGDNGPAIDAQINEPRRVACAPNGDLLIAHGIKIRAVDRAGMIRTVRDGIDGPSGLLVNPEGLIYYSESGTHRVMRYDPSRRSSTVIAGTGTAGFSGDGGSATAALLNSPGDLAFDSQGNLLIADRDNRRIRRVTRAGIIQTIAGSSRAFWHTDTTGQLATAIGLARIEGLAVDTQDNIYISENVRVSVVDSAGQIRILTGYVGQEDNGVKLYIDGPLNGADALATGFDGRLYVSVRDEGRVLVTN